MVTATKSKLTHTGSREVISGGKGATEGLGEVGVKKGIGVVGHHLAWGIPLVTALLAAVSLYEHHKQKDLIKDEYKDEIAARLGKPRNKVTTADMEKVAKKNPALAEAVERSKTTRNLSIGVTIAGAIAGVTLIPLLAAPVIGALGITGLAATVAEFAVSALGFLGIEEGLEKIGKKIFHLEEPSFKEIAHKPARQGELSVPTQVSYISHQHTKGKMVTQEQVMTVFTTAHPEIDAKIKARYGAGFAKLGNKTKHEVLENLGAQFHIDALTAGINSGQIRAQELAFSAYGQDSGAAQHSQLAQLRREETQLERQKEAVDARISAQAPATNEDLAKQKLAFAHSRVSGAVPLSEQALADQEEQTTTGWGKRVTDGDLSRSAGSLSPAFT